MKNSDSKESQNHNDIRNRIQGLRLDTSVSKPIPPLPKTLSSITEESPEESPSQPLSASNIAPEKSQSNGK